MKCRLSFSFDNESSVVAVVVYVIARCCWLLPYSYKFSHGQIFAQKLNLREISEVFCRCAKICPRENLLLVVGCCDTPIVAIVFFVVKPFFLS